MIVLLNPHHKGAVTSQAPANLIFALPCLLLLTSAITKQKRLELQQQEVRRSNELRERGQGHRIISMFHVTQPPILRAAKQQFSRITVTITPGSFDGSLDNT